MANTYDVEYTDTFGGEANYSWVNRKTVTMPELTHWLKDLLTAADASLPYPDDGIIDPEFDE